MRATLLAGTAALLGLSTSAYALQETVPSARDEHIRYVNYRADDIVDVWSNRGAAVSIEFSENETIDAVPVPDKTALEAGPRGHYLFLKFKKCVSGQFLFVLTNLSGGGQRRYALRLNTTSANCDDSAKDGTKVAAADGGTVTDATPVRRIDAIVAYLYPGEIAQKRKQTARETRAKAAKDAADAVLNREIEMKSSDPWYGIRNLAYSGRGAAVLAPQDGDLWDNGYLTTIRYRGLQRMPAVFRPADPAAGCRVDGHEQTANYSVRGDAMILTGTAQTWCLRDGGNVYQVWNNRWDPVGLKPGTGTASPFVERVAK